MARNKYPEITEARILDTATKLFLEKGWEETTVQDIVDELGDITRGAFYHHFKSKDDIIDAVTTRMFLGNNPFKAVEESKSLNGLQIFFAASGHFTVQPGSIQCAAKSHLHWQTGFGQYQLYGAFFYSVYFRRNK